ncbi:hypothetical protein SAMCFNEI73_Ch1223 [Sinorhizobium americanum]|uniref:Uncharacterized protein n=1 Tax=Sinorhizobium americanum TaxID=194963 RepID=A0A1L3LKC8_9HYPH|nr:hypothetical protein SAMCFNEI73_Ch1223 [Sinorhizobium americanum]
MRLSAVMGLVVEEMGERRSDLLADLAGPAERRVGEVRVEPRLVEAIDPSDDALVLRDPRRRQGREFVMQNRVEPRGCVALLGEPLHPDPVSDEEVIERSMQRAEERALVLPVLLIGEFGRGSVEQPVGPAIVVGKHPVMVEHHLLPCCPASLARIDIRVSNATHENY